MSKQPSSSRSHHTSSHPPDILRSTGSSTSEPVLERASSRLFLEGRGKGMKKTVEKLKRLMEVELRASVEKNLDLVEAVFPDESLPFLINQDLIDKLTPGHQTRKKTKRAGHSLNPPSEWSENKIAAWLNQIGDALRKAHRAEDFGTYTDVDGKKASLPERIWRSDYSGVYLDGSEAKRKPDLILVDKGTLTSALTWSQVHALGEVTVSALSKNKTILDTIYQKSFIITNAQDNRNFVPTLYFTGTDSFTFEVCDRSGSVHSQTMKIADNRLTLLRAIAGLMFGRPSEIGYDETIDCNIRGEATAIRVAGAKYEVVKSLFKAESMRGRVTRCWHVMRIEEEIPIHYVIKDSWADQRRTQSEVSTLELIRNLHSSEGFYGIPKLFKGEDVLVYLYGDVPGYKSDSTIRRRAAGSKVEGRVHRRLLMQPVGKHIISFASLKELVGGIIDTVKAHETLFTNKILHRDISINNILLTSKEDGQRSRGLLIDYDYAFLYKDEPEDAGATISEHLNQSHEVLLHRTGTLPFMSTELLLSDPPVEHSEKHDLESFFWVLVFICTVYEGPDRRSDLIRDNTHPFGIWIQQLDNIGTDKEGADTRLRVFGSFRSTLFLGVSEGGLFRKHIHVYFQPLSKLIDDFARAIFQVMEGGGKEVIVATQASGTYKSVLDVLNRAFDNLPDIDPVPPSSTLLSLAPSSASSSNPVHPSGPAFSSKPASSKRTGEFKIPALPIRKSARKPSTSNVSNSDQSLANVDSGESSKPSTPPKRKGKNLPPTSPRKSPRKRGKSSSYDTGEMSIFSEGVDDIDEGGIQRRGSSSSNKRAGEESEGNAKQTKRRRGI